MKLFAGMIISAALTAATGAAHAQQLAPYRIGTPYTLASDFESPYAATPPGLEAWRYGPSLLPPLEVYTIVRESGFSPLGIPQQRGFIYTISVITRDGDDGRLVIDARNGRILRFMPAYRLGGNFNDELTVSYGPVGPPPPVSDLREPSRSPVYVPRMASRTPSVRTEKAMPRATGEAKPLAARPASRPARHAAVQAKPVAIRADPGAAAPPPAVEAKPSTPQVQPTQAMPAAQGLD